MYNGIKSDIYVFSYTGFEDGLLEAVDQSNLANVGESQTPSEPPEVVYHLQCVNSDGCYNMPDCCIGDPFGEGGFCSCNC